MGNTYLYDCSNNKYTNESNNRIQLVRIDDIYEYGSFNIIFYIYLQGIPNGSSNSEVQWFDC